MSRKCVHCECDETESDMESCANCVRWCCDDCIEWCCDPDDEPNGDYFCKDCAVIEPDTPSGTPENVVKEPNQRPISPAPHAGSVKPSTHTPERAAEVVQYHMHEIVAVGDGSCLFYPYCSSFRAADLRAIADELDRRNSEVRGNGDSH